LQRNHSVQYISIPGFEWQKLRSDTPGKYESYTDLIPGQWTQMKIQVAGSRARLYVNGAEQPTLIVNDLKQSSVNGAIALWVGAGNHCSFCRPEGYALTVLIIDFPRHVRAIRGRVPSEVEFHAPEAKKTVDGRSTTLP
jgi:hypothetical protein